MERDTTLMSGKISLAQFEFGGCNTDTRTRLRDFSISLKPVKRAILRKLAKQHGAHILVETGTYQGTLKALRIASTNSIRSN